MRKGRHFVKGLKVLITQCRVQAAQMVLKPGAKVIPSSPLVDPIKLRLWLALKAGLITFGRPDDGGGIADRTARVVPFPFCSLRVMIVLAG